MNIPKGFRPEKNLEEHFEGLRFPQKKKIRDVTDLILDKKVNLVEFLFVDYDSSFSNYPFLKDTGDDVVFNGIFIEYAEFNVVEVLEFKYEDVLNNYLSDISGFVDDFNKSRQFTATLAFFKDSYLIFIYTSPGDCYPRTEFINAYKKKFGFKEVKAD